MIQLSDSTITSEVKRAFNILNENLFDGKLEEVSVSIQPKKKHALKWMSDIKSLIIGGDFIKLEFNEILGTLLHEMIHIMNFQRGISDVTINQYHNKHFLEYALKVGFVVIKHKTQGWSITTTIYPRNVVECFHVKKPNKDSINLRNQIFNLIDLKKSVIKHGNVEIRNFVRDEKPTKTFFLKYQCNCLPPHNSFRSGRRPDGLNRLNVQCLDCSSKFECVTPLDVDERS